MKPKDKLDELITQVQHLPKDKQESELRRLIEANIDNFEQEDLEAILRNIENDITNLDSKQ